jgi:NADPH-dependent curcumin reductase CurA
MKKCGAVLVIVLAVFCMVGCTTYKPFAVTENAVGSKVGVATATTNFLWGNFVSGTADFSIQTAAKNGGISKIATVDVKVKDTLRLFTTYTTIVTGE